MALADWFATIDLGDPTQAQQAVVDELAAMLDNYRPAHLDRKASSIQVTGHGWTLDHTIAVQLVHADDPDAMIELAVGTGEVIVSWLTAHEHLYADEDSPEGRVVAVLSIATLVLLGATAGPATTASPPTTTEIAYAAFSNPQGVPTTMDLSVSSSGGTVTLLTETTLLLLTP